MSTTTRQLVPNGLTLESLAATQKDLTIRATPTSTCVRCPECGAYSERIHSRYSRTVLDLPWQGISVKLQIRARKLFCDDTGCERMIFCERLEEIAARARKTGRLEETLRAIAFELGGRAGARLAAELGLLLGRDALLERIRCSSKSVAGKVKVIGVDDFAFRKASKYVTGSRFLYHSR